MQSPLLPSCGMFAYFGWIDGSLRHLYRETSSQKPLCKMSSIKKEKKTSRADVIHQEDILQAVVIADSFNERFGPITQTKPRTLLPIVNCPILDYTLEFLESAGIQEVILFCCCFADQIKNHIRSSKWNYCSSFTVTVIVSESCMSLGDVLRDIDAKALIRSDFILISGDTVSNMLFQPVLDAHKHRRLKDKSSVMTMVFKKAAPKHRIRCFEEDIVAASEAKTNRLLHYQKVGHQKKICFPLDIFLDHSEVQIRYDLLDCHISVCSSQVPPLFADNFDYLSRDDFVRGILVNEEILGNQIHMYVVEDEYAARVSNFQMYDAVSQDIINRWVYPYVPDLHIGDSGNNYSYGRHNIYLHHKDVALARGCDLKQDVVVGQGTKIGTDTFITHSVIGKNCLIGDHVTIEGAFLWDNVVVNDGCCIKKAVLASNVELKKGVKVEPGCVLSYQVIVGEGMLIPQGTLLMSEPQAKSKDSFDFDDEELKQEGSAIACCTEIVGNDGIGYLYNPPVDSDAESDDVKNDTWGLIVPSEEDDDESSVAYSGEEDISPTTSPPPDDVRRFYNEVLDSLLRGIDEDIRWDNLALEITCSRNAYGVSVNELNTLVTKAILDIPEIKSKKSLQSSEFLNNLKQYLLRWTPLLKNYLKNSDSQMDCLKALEDYAVYHENFSLILMKVLHLLYEQEVLGEETILRWYKLLPQNTSNVKVVKDQVAPFIKWLQEAEEESDSEDDS